MKTKQGFVLRNVAGSNIVVPTGKTCMDFNGMITMNDTAAFIWNCLQEDTTQEEIVVSILREYDVDEATAAACVRDVLDKLTEAGCIE